MIIFPMNQLSTDFFFLSAFNHKMWEMLLHNICFACSINLKTIYWKHVKESGV